MTVNEFKKAKLSQELFDKLSAYDSIREMLKVLEAEGIALDEEEESIFASMMGEKKVRPEGSVTVEWNSDCYNRFKLHDETCADYKEREYLSDNCWEGGVDPRKEVVEKEPVCLNCQYARSKQYYCFCEK